MLINDLHESGIDPCRESGMMFDGRTLCRNRSLFHIIDDLHRMRVTHGYGRDLDCLAVDIKWLDDCSGIRVERDTGRVQHRDPHIDSHQSAVNELRGNDAAFGFHSDFRFVGQAFFDDEADEAACTISALFNFSTIGIEDPVAKIGVGGCRAFYNQNLVAPHSEAPVGKVADLLGSQADGLADSVDDDEIISQPLHFGEF